MKRAGVAGFDPLDWVGRHRFLVGSVALHMLIAGGLWLLGPQVAVQAQRAQEAARSEATLRKAQHEQVQRHLKRFEQLGKQAGAELPDSAASSPLERAEALTKRLEETERQARIKELARLLKTSPKEATDQVRLEDWKRQKPAPRDAAQALAQLESRARDAVERQRAREQREREGLRVAGRAGAVGGGGDGKSGQGRDEGQRGHGPGGEGQTGWQGGGWQGTNYRRDYDAAAATPQIDPAQVRFAAGRRFGPGGPYANRVYLDRWNVIGPFPAPARRDLMDIVQPPEIAVDLDAVHPGKHGLVGWRPQQSPTYPFVPEPWEEYAIYYAATEVRVDRDMDVWLDIGADDDTKLWLNDELVWVGGNGIKPWYLQHYSGLPGMATAGLVEGRVRVHLRAGRNTLLLKLYNAPMETFFSIVIAS